MSTTQKAPFGKLPAHLDPFALPIARMPRIRFADEGGDGAGAGDSDGADGAGSDSSTLGDAGKQALDRMKNERNEAKAEAKAFKDLGLTVDQIKQLQAAQSSKGDDSDSVDVSAIEARIRASVQAENDTRIAKAARSSEVRAQAAELGFVKPAQALALINAADLEKVTVDSDGEPDKVAVKALLDALATDSPHLLKPTDTTADHRTAGIGSTSSGTKPDVQPGLARMRSAYADTK